MTKEIAFCGQIDINLIGKYTARKNISQGILILKLVLNYYKKGRKEKPNLVK